MPRVRWFVRLAALAAIAVGVVGCAKENAPARYPVSGTVTLDKKPLEKGMIFFQVIATGEMDAMPVENGAFSGRTGEGERRVEVVSEVSRGEKDFGGMKGEFRENIIPAKYNVDTTLKATVTAAGPNTFTFDLTSK
jgi:hypothetical protein